MLRKIFGIQENEKSRVLLMFGYLFLVISCLLIVKPVRNSLFLKNFGAANLPYVFILVAISAAILTHFYSRYAGKMALNRLINNTLVIIIVNLFVVWGLLQAEYNAPWFIYGFYVWVAIFAVITTSQFWTLANEIFNAREAKRLFGFIGAGGITGGITGGYATTYLAPLVGTRNLLLFCIVFLVVCAVIARKIWAQREEEISSRPVKAESRKSESTRGIIAILKESRHLRLLTLIVGIGVIVANLVDFQYSTIAELSISDEDELTAFFGFWLSNLSICSLLIQLFLTRRVMSGFGVIPSLLFLPVGILAGAAAIIFSPALWSGVLIKVSEGAFKQSIHKAGLELLILPVPPDRKRQAKAFIDIFVDSLATGTGGLLLLFFTGWLQFSVGGISAVIIALVSVWILVTIAIRSEYIAAFRSAIEKREIDPQEIQINPNDAQMMDNLISALESGQERQILYALDLLSGYQDSRLMPRLQQLLQNPSAAVRTAALQMLSDYPEAAVTTEQARQFLYDPSDELRMTAVDYLVITSPAEQQAALFLELLEDNSMQVRSAAIICIANAIGHKKMQLPSIDFRELISSGLQDIATTAEIDEEPLLMARAYTEAIGIAGVKNLYPLLTPLLNHANTDIAKSAISSAGLSGDPRFVQDLIPKLRVSRVRKEVRESLALLGQDSLQPLLQNLDDSGMHFMIRRNIPRVIQGFMTQEAADALIERLQFPQPQIRQLIIKALGGMHRDNSDIVFHPDIVRAAIFSEVANYHILLSLSYRLRRQPANTQAGILLEQALVEKCQNNLERIFRLLGLIYRQRDIFLAWLGIASNNQTLRANAVEFIDNVLDLELKRQIVPIVENDEIEQTITTLRQRFRIKIPENNYACLKALLTDRDPWIQSCTLYLISCQPRKEYRQLILPLLEAPDFLVRETAELALRKNHE